MKKKKNRKLINTTHKKAARHDGITAEMLQQGHKHLRYFCIETNYTKENNTYVASIDLEKAFDSAPKTLIWKSLEKKRSK